MTTDSTWTSALVQSGVMGDLRYQIHSWTGAGTECTGGSITTGFDVVHGACVMESSLTISVPLKYTTAAGCAVTVIFAAGATNAGKLMVWGR